MKNRKPIAVAACTIAALAIAAAVTFPGLEKRKVLSSKTRHSVAQQREVDHFLALLNDGIKALKRKDYSAAESLLSTAKKARPDNLTVEMSLARVYDATHRDQEAYEAYKRVLHPTNGSSTFEIDPQVLARYGDLCIEFAKPSEARRAYAAAISGKDLAGAHMPSVDADTKSLGASAHRVASERLLVQGDSAEAEKELLIANSADPNDWQSQYYLGVAQSMLGKTEAAKTAFAAAERIAPAKDLAKLRRRRAVLGIGQDATTNVIEIHGKTATLKEVPLEFKPKTR
jgi:tetratricopeptide (TPR) repeat protein